LPIELESGMTDDQPIEEGSAEPQPTCPKCGGEMWDNRESKRNPRAPDYKCKSASCDGVIWPPREAGAPVAPATPSGGPDDPACPVCGGKMWDDRASKRNPRAPDFKCRNKPKYQGAPGCPGVIWPPRDGERRPAASTSGPAGRATKRAAVPPPPAVEREFKDDEIPDFGEDEELPF
jgi:hypothetical protein